MQCGKNSQKPDRSGRSNFTKKLTKQLKSLPVGPASAVRLRKASTRVTTLAPPNRGSLQWNEPAVREALRSWADKARTVCLIIPPSAFLLDERVFVSLGVLKVAASLEAQRYRVNLLDLSGVQITHQAVSRTSPRGRPILKLISRGPARQAEQDAWRYLSIVEKPEGLPAESQ